MMRHNNKKKSYEELSRLKTFQERFIYLSLNNSARYFDNHEQYLSQKLYKLNRWKHIRDEVIFRDSACDLGILGRDIFSGVLIHHMNPISIQDIREGNDCVFDINNLITTTVSTHNAIHYSNPNLVFDLFRDRKKGDTIPWKIF